MDKKKKKIKEISDAEYNERNPEWNEYLGDMEEKERLEKQSGISMGRSTIKKKKKKKAGTGNHPKNK